MSEEIPARMEQWKELIAMKAEQFQFDPFILAGLIWTESSGDDRAVRFEPRFTWFFDPSEGALHSPNLSVAQNRKRAFDILGGDEFDWQSASHGLCQVMGAIAREMGFTGTPESFYEPETNIHYGVKHLAAHLRRTGGDITQALLRYNGGGDSSYPSKVLRRAEILKNA